MKNKTIYKMTLAALFLALTLILPFITAQIQAVGMMLLPMHFPVILCGMLCGPFYGLVVGIVGPILRSALFSMPMMFPTAIAMSVELGVYGLVSGWLYRKLGEKKLSSIYIALISAMILGRIAWGLTTWGLLGVSGSPFSFEIFLQSAVISGLPGIALQLILIPLIVYPLETQKKRRRYNGR